MVPALISVQADKLGEHMAVGPMVRFTPPRNPGAVPRPATLSYTPALLTHTFDPHSSPPFFRQWVV